MIDWWQALVLALVQGLTEFLPISSSAHLVIPSLILGWEDQGLAFDVAVHVGTLSAVLFYYRHEVAKLMRDWTASLYSRRRTQSSQLAWYLLAASVPVALVGALGAHFIETNLRNLPVIAATTLLFGLLLGYADKYSRGRDGKREMNLLAALVIGR